MKATEKNYRMQEGSMKSETLKERIEDESRVPLAVVFVERLREIARINGISEDQAWATWKKYSTDCDSMGQSALMSECAQWNNWKEAR